MSKHKYIKVPIPKLNWSSWQITRFVFLVIIAFRLDGKEEIIALLKVLIKLWSG